MKHICKTPATALKTRAALLTSSFLLLTSSFAKTFDWPIDAPTAGARQFTAYHGETVRFNLQFRGAMTNLSPVAIYYQTNGMGKAEWFGPVPGTVFHPTNDCGAAAYRFFILCNDPDGINYTANGSLRLLDSPGFVPNELPLPVQTLDFSRITVLNPPWSDYTDEATNALRQGIEGGDITAMNAVWAADASHATTAYGLGAGDTMRTPEAIFAQIDAATQTNAQQDAALAAIPSIASNAAVAATAPRFRPFGDEYVYESTGMGDFTWSSDRADILAALGTMQPYLSYEYENYGEWHLDFSVGATNYWGYAYAPLNSPEVEFYVDGYFWDDSTGDEHYDYATVVGSRAPGGYNRANPVDKFAHQSEVTLMHAKITSISNLVVGENKVMRTGKEGELGTGWGFIQSRLDDERRYWRIQVPKITIQGLEAYSPSTTGQYLNPDGGSAGVAALPNIQRTVQVKNGQTTTNFNDYTASWSPIQSNLLKKYPGWNTYSYVLKRTMGAYSIDKVIAASYRLGIMPSSTNGSVFAVAYGIDASIISSDNKQSFLITLDVDRLLANGFTERTVGGTLSYYRPIEPIECVVTSVTSVAVQHNASSSISITNRFSALVNGIGINVPRTNEYWNGRSPYIMLPIYYDFDFNFVADCHVNPGDYEYTYSGTNPYTNYYHIVETNYTMSLAVEHAMMNQDVRINYPGTISNSDYTFNTYEDRYATYYKVVTTLDPYSHMYYDPMADATYKISLYNGVYLSEKQCDGDWREQQETFVPTNDVQMAAREVEVRELGRIEALEIELSALTNSVIQLQSLNLELTDRIADLEGAIHSITNNAN